MPNRLKYYRTIKNDMTIKQLSEKSGVNVNTISQLERHPERVNNTTKTLERLAVALGGTVRDIFFNSCV